MVLVMRSLYWFGSRMGTAIGLMPWWAKGSELQYLCLCLLERLQSQS